METDCVSSLSDSAIVGAVGALEYLCHAAAASSADLETRYQAPLGEPGHCGIGLSTGHIGPRRRDSACTLGNGYHLVLWSVQLSRIRSSRICVHFRCRATRRNTASARCVSMHSSSAGTYCDIVDCDQLISKVPSNSGEHILTYQPTASRLLFGRADIASLLLRHVEDGESCSRELAGEINLSAVRGRPEPPQSIAQGDYDM